MLKCSNETPQGCEEVQIEIRQGGANQLSHSGYLLSWYSVYDDDEEIDLYYGDDDFQDDDDDDDWVRAQECK